MFKKYLQLFCISIEIITRWAGKFAALLMPILAFIVAFEVFSRYILDKPTIWAYDLSLFLFGYISALGGAYAQQKRAHINVDIFYLSVSPKTKSVFNLVSFSLGIFFLLIIFMMSLGKLSEALEFDYRRQSEWAPPMWNFWVMLCIASFLFIAQLFKDILSELYLFITDKTLFEGNTNHGH